MAVMIPNLIRWPIIIATTVALIGCSSTYLVYKDLNPHVIDRESFHDQWIGEDEFNSIIANADALDIKTQTYFVRGVYDFKNKPVRFVGESECYASVEGSHTFLTFGEGAIIKNLVVYRSPLDGIEILGNVKIEDSRILHSCDEAFTLRSNAKLEIRNSVIKNHINKGFMMDSPSELVMDGVAMTGWQMIAPCNEGNRVTIKNSSFRKHPLADYAQVFSGDDCIDIEINWYSDNKLFTEVAFNGMVGERENVEINQIDADID